MSHSLPSRSTALLPLGAAFLGLAPSQPLAAAPSVSRQIIVDQIGYRTTARKVGIVADPVMGYNKADRYVPGDSLIVRKVSDDSRVLAVKLGQWNGGKADTSTGTISLYDNATGGNKDTTILTAFAGDRTWWADFSALTTAGDYYLYDPLNDRKSYDFRIGDDVYDKALQAAVRMYYYQRQGMDLDAKYAGVWNHKADRLQDSVATTWSGDTLPRDVRGGWWDAGDPNKYVPFTTRPIWQLLNAYENNAQAFSDATDIPESGNGVPDLLDEVKWELDWILKMQNADGSTHSRVVDHEGTSYPGVGGPEAIKAKRHYTLASTWSSASLAASCAHASRLFRAFDKQFPGYADTLLKRAELAWTYLEAHPTQFPADGKDGMITADGKVDSRAGGGNEYEVGGRLLAAAELFRATGTAKYRTWFDTKMTINVLSGSSVFDPMGGTAGTNNGWVGQMALITYAQTVGATAANVAKIQKALREVNWWYNPTAEVTSTSAKPYLVENWYYPWGSNETMSDWGLVPIYGKLIGISPDAGEDLMAKGEEYVHYLLGRNPMNLVYMTNVGKKGLDLGADSCAMSIFHLWFMKKTGYADFDGSASLYGPPPGYVPGGPNYSYTYNTGSGILQELRFQPQMKTYKDWSGDWPENSWEITEPGIYYQGAVVNLLSWFVTGSNTKAPLVATGIPTPSRSGLSRASAVLRGQDLSIAGVESATATLLDPAGQVLERFEIRGGKAVLSNRATGMLLLRLEATGLDAVVPVVSLR